MSQNQILYLMMGLPGAGKTTAAKIIEELTGAIRLTSDEARFMIWDKPEFNEQEHLELYEYLNEQTARLLQKGKSVIYDANLNRYEHRMEKYDLASQLGVPVVLVWVKTKQELAKSRAVDHRRKHLWKKDETPEDMFERVAGTIEEPQADESPRIINGSNITNAAIRQLLDL